MFEGSKEINSFQQFEVPKEELFFEFFRSSKPGGQNVNKVSSGIRLRWNVRKSGILTEEQKEKIIKRYPKKITNKGDLIIECEESRSQLKNKKIALERFNKILENSLKEEKRRKKIKPSKDAIEARLKEKKEISEKKEEDKSQ